MDVIGPYTTAQEDEREVKKLGYWLVVWPMRAEARERRATAANSVAEAVRIAKEYSEKTQGEIGLEASQGVLKSCGTTIVHLDDWMISNMASRSVMKALRTKLARAAANHAVKAIVSTNASVSCRARSSVAIS